MQAYNCVYLRVCACVSSFSYSFVSILYFIVFVFVFVCPDVHSEVPLRKCVATCSESATQRATEPTRIDPKTSLNEQRCLWLKTKRTNCSQTRYPLIRASHVAGLFSCWSDHLSLHKRCDMVDCWCHGGLINRVNTHRRAH